MTLTDLFFISLLLITSWVFAGDFAKPAKDQPTPPAKLDEEEEGEEQATGGCRLARMWEQQEEFMRLLQDRRGFPDFPTDITSKQGQKFLKDITHHIMDELFEASQHLKNSKSHRATLIPEIDKEAYKEELVDALHLYFELVIASGITLDELVEAYLAKGGVNTARIRGTY